tara:strand:+ start:443 stop:859 length:417 start_codon:yes stop_codon:yes gene_type:complete
MNSEIKEEKEKFKKLELKRNIDEELKQIEKLEKINKFTSSVKSFIWYYFYYLSKKDFHQYKENLIKLSKDIKVSSGKLRNWVSIYILVAIYILVFKLQANTIYVLITIFFILMYAEYRKKIHIHIHREHKRKKYMKEL